MTVNNEVVGLVITDLKGNVLMQSHVKHAMLTVSCGKVDEGETPFLAAIREAKEELDIVIDIEHLSVLSIDLHEYPEYGVCRQHLLFVNHYEGDIKNVEPEKHDWISFKSIDWIRADNMRKSNLLMRYLELNKENGGRGLRHPHMFFAPLDSEYTPKLGNFIDSPKIWDGTDNQNHEEL